MSKLILAIKAKKVDKVTDIKIPYAPKDVKKGEYHN